jgi:flavin-dependent dehydrogenase
LKLHDVCPVESLRMAVYDVAIVGAGPAGSCAARLLAAWKHRVVVLHRRTPTLAVAESLPPSCRKLFAACGVLDPVERASFYRSTGNTVWWGSDEPRREPFPPGASGYQVDRDEFDDLLRSEARAAGAELVETLVRKVELHGTRACIRREDGGPVDARFVLDCSGRAGVIARDGWRTAIDAHPRTVALAGVWTSRDGWANVDPTHTLVDSYEDGWAWSVPLSPHRRYVTMMIDPQRTQLARGRPAAEIYGAELTKATHLAAVLQRSTLERGPWGCDASVYAAHTYAADPALLVGDAASFVDPLSSYGVKKALASAWLAAVAVHTALAAPALTATALSFFAARESAMAASLERQWRALVSDAASAHAHAFWSDRAAGVDDRGDDEPDPRVLRDDPRVQQAFSWLKSMHALALRPAATLRRAPHPVVRGHAIVLEERLVSDAAPLGMRFLRDVDLLALLALAPEHDQVPPLFDSYNRRYPPVALADFLGALSVMVAFGFLEDSRASAG